MRTPRTWVRYLYMQRYHVTPNYGWPPACLQDFLYTPMTRRSMACLLLE